MARITGSMAEELARLESRSERSASGCLLAPSKSYAEFKYDRGAGRVRAIRAAYMIHVGPIPEGHLIRHSCDQPRCIAIAHLSTGSVADNSRDMAERRRGLIGLRHHFAAVTPEQIAAAVDEYLRGGKSQAEMAARMGVGPTTFGRWVRADSRRDVARKGVTVGVGSRIATGLLGCGTRAGYFWHRNHNEPMCDPCRQANADYMRAYKADRKTARVWVGAS